MSDERKDYFQMKNSIKKESYTVADGYTDFLESMGLRETKKAQYKKQVYKYTAINKSENQQVNVQQSIYSHGLQRSEYLQIDNKLMFELHSQPSKMTAQTLTDNHKRN